MTPHRRTWRCWTISVLRRSSTTAGTASIPRRSARFPPELEAHIDREVRSFLAHHRIGFAYGSLASGADILVAEALLDQGVPLQVVLPFDTAEFERTSVTPAGQRWGERFRSCLDRADSVVHASDSSFMGDDELYGYAGRIAMGHALNRAAFLDAPAEQLAIWDQADGAVLAGTAHDVAVWRASGHPTHVIALRPPEDSPEVRYPSRRPGRSAPSSSPISTGSPASETSSSLSSSMGFSERWVPCSMIMARPSYGATPGATLSPPYSPT